MAEEVSDVKEAEVAPVTEAPAELTATEESSPKEIDLAPVETLEDKTESDEAEEPAKEPEAEPDESEKPAKGAEARKEQLSNEIRDLVSKRASLRDEIAAENAKVYAPQTAEQLVEEGQTPEMARVMALEQRTEMAEYNAKVTDLNANLSQQSLQVMHDFPQFDSSSPQYDESLSKRVATIYQRVAGIQTDPNTGLTIAANVLPYDIYKEFAEVQASGAQNGQVQGQKSAEKMLAAADSPSSAAPKRAAQNDFLKGLMG